MTETPAIFRTYKQGVFKLYESAWGKYLGPAIDPDANVIEFTEEHFKMFELNEEIHQIPSDLWSAWIDLCFYYAEKINKNLEVSIRILRSETDPSQYKFIVPKQEVGKASVRAKDFQISVDLISGEELTSYPPDGWTPIGSSHSHNTMDAFFSGTDDQYELSDPGIHIVVGSINNETDEYNLSVSVTANNRRFLVNKEDEKRIINFGQNFDSTYHEKVLEYVSVLREVIPKVTKYFNGTKVQANLEKHFVGNFQNYAKDHSDMWHQESLNATNVNEIEAAILEFVDQFEYEPKKLTHLLGILQDCEDAISSQLMEIDNIFKENLT